MKNLKFIFLLSLVTILSCNDEIVETATRLPGKFDVSKEVAMKLARRLDLDNPYKSTASNFRSDNQNELEWVEVIEDGENSAGFFVINFANDGGFVILSGDYRTVPIFAVSSSGSFPSPGDTIDQGIAMMMDEALDHLIYIRDTVDLPTVPEDILQLWSGAGLYAVLPPPSSCDCEASNLSWQCVEQCEISGSGGGSGGNSSTTVTTFGPLMTTVWDQSGTYNNLAPIINGTCQALTGCVATAMAQVMRYHEHPSSYNWSSMPDGLVANGWGTRAQLLRDCGDAVDMNWGCDGSGADMDKAKRALRDDFNYSSSLDYVSYNMLTAKGNILGYKPVILTGCMTSGSFLLWNTYTDCHAWVADGVRTTTVTFSSTGNTSSTHELYMNWGWGGSRNSWFTDFQATTASNFQFNKKMIKNIYPN